MAYSKYLGHWSSLIKLMYYPIQKCKKEFILALISHQIWYCIAICSHFTNCMPLWTTWLNPYQHGYFTKANTLPCFALLCLTQECSLGKKPVRFCRWELVYMQISRWDSWYWMFVNADWIYWALLFAADSPCIFER